MRILLISLFYAGTAFAFEPTQVSADFDFERATGQSPRGQASYLYKSCLSAVTISFSESVSYASLLGQVTLIDRFNSKKPLAIADVSRDSKRITFTPTDGGQFCDKTHAYETILIGSGVASEDSELGPAGYIKFKYPQGRNFSSSKGLSNELNFVRSGIPSKRQLNFLGTAKKDSECAPAQKFRLTNLQPTDAVTGDTIARAYRKVEHFLGNEKRRSIYRSNRVTKLSRHGTILEPRGPKSSSRHYGRPDLILQVRRAAIFTQNLFPDLKAIGLADMTTSSGETPYATFANSKTYLHPKGSHTGSDVDIGYISTGSGNDRDEAIDIEKSFWMLYALLETVGVDLVYTAYKQEFLEYAHSAYQQGLISATAYARFASPRIIADANLAHDSHMHVNISYHDYNKKSLRFQKADNSFNCLLGITPRGLSGQNFCL